MSVFKMFAPGYSGVVTSIGTRQLEASGSQGDRSQARSQLNTDKVAFMAPSIILSISCVSLMAFPRIAKLSR